MRVMCLQRVPAFVVPMHCTVLPWPCSLLGLDFLADWISGLQILHGSRPDSNASSILILSDTFSTILQDAR